MLSDHQRARAENLAEHHTGRGDDIGPLVLELLEEIDRLRGMSQRLAVRVAAQAELLARRAEKQEGGAE